MKFTASKNAAAALGAGAIAVAASGVAYAYYNASVSGSKTGTASVTDSEVSDVTPTDATAASGLVPGGDSVDVTVTLSNDNPFSVHIPAGKSLSVTGMTGGPTGCDTLTLAGISGSAPIDAQTIDANEDTTVTVPVSMADGDGNQTPCKGQSFTLTYSVGTTP
jgi:hypothetical protein